MFIANQHGDEYVVCEAALEHHPHADERRRAAREDDPRRADRHDRAARQRRRLRRRRDRPPATPVAAELDPCCARAVPARSTRTAAATTSTATTRTQRSTTEHPYQPGQDDPTRCRRRSPCGCCGTSGSRSSVVDFHHQGTYVDDEGRMITGSIMWPNADEEAERLGIGAQFDETVDDSKRAVSMMLTAVESKGYANITRYPSTTSARHRPQRLRPARLGLGADRDARRHRSEVQRLHRQDGLRRVRSR